MTLALEMTNTEMTNATRHPRDLSQIQVVTNRTFLTTRSRGQFLAVKDLELPQSQLLQPELGEYPQGGAAVFDAAAEVDAGGFGEVADRDWDVAELEAEVDSLCEKLAVEGEVVGVVPPRDRFENFAAIGTEAAVEVTQVLSEGDILC